MACICQKVMWQLCAGNSAVAARPQPSSAYQGYRKQSHQGGKSCCSSLACRSVGAADEGHERHDQEHSIRRQCIAQSCDELRQELHGACLSPSCSAGAQQGQHVPAADQALSRGLRHADTRLSRRALLTCALLSLSALLLTLRRKVALAAATSAGQDRLCCLGWTTAHWHCRTQL